MSSQKNDTVENFEKNRNLLYKLAEIYGLNKYYISRCKPLTKEMYDNFMSLVYQSYEMAQLGEMREELSKENGDSTNYVDLQWEYIGRQNELLGSNLILGGKGDNTPCFTNYDDLGICTTELERYFFHKERAYKALCHALGCSDTVTYAYLIEYFITKPGKAWLAKKFDLDEDFTWIDILEIFREDIATKCGLGADADWNEIDEYEKKQRERKGTYRIYKPKKETIRKKGIATRRAAMLHDVREVAEAVGGDKEINQDSVDKTIQYLADEARPAKHQQAIH